MPPTCSLSVRLVTFGFNKPTLSRFFLGSIRTPVRDALIKVHSFGLRYMRPISGLAPARLGSVQGVGSAFARLRPGCPLRLLEHVPRVGLGSTGSTLQRPRRLGQRPHQNRSRPHPSTVRPSSSLFSLFSGACQSFPKLRPTGPSSALTEAPSGPEQSKAPRIPVISLEAGPGQAKAKGLPVNSSFVNRFRAKQSSQAESPCQGKTQGQSQNQGRKDPTRPQARP